MGFLMLNIIFLVRRPFFSQEVRAAMIMIYKNKLLY